MVFASYSLVEYFGTLAFPANLLYMHLFPMSPGLPLPVRYFIYPVIVAAFTYLLIRLVKFKNWPVFFGLVFFLINIALMLHVVAMSRFTIIADRYVYLASVGIFFIVTWYAVPWLQKMASSGKKWTLAVAVCYLLYLGGYAHYRTYAWKDSDTLKKEFRKLVNEDLLKQNTSNH
jgi:hypothetical protein